MRCSFFKISLKKHNVLPDNKELSVNFITREFIMDKNFECATIMHQTVDQKSLKKLSFKEAISKMYMYKIVLLMSVILLAQI